MFKLNWLIWSCFMTTLKYLSVTSSAKIILSCCLDYRFFIVCVFDFSRVSMLSVGRLRCHIYRPLSSYMSSFIKAEVTPKVTILIHIRLWHSCLITIYRGRLGESWRSYCHQFSRLYCSWVLVWTLPWTPQGCQMFMEQRWLRLWWIWSDSRVCLRMTAGSCVVWRTWNLRMEVLPGRTVLVTTAVYGR